MSGHVYVAVQYVVRVLHSVHLQLVSYNKLASKSHYECLVKLYSIRLRFQTCLKPIHRGLFSCYLGLFFNRFIH